MEAKRLNESPIHYYVTGNEQGECLMFLHAAFVDHSMFDTQVEYFKDKYKIVTMDLIGHGQSVKTKKGDSIENMADWILQIIEKEQVNKVHLIGISLGSLIIQDFANKFPEKVNSLACFGGYDINNFDLAMQKGNNKEQSLMMLKAIFSIKWFAKSNKKIIAFTERAQEEFYQMNIRFPKKSFMYLASLNKMVNKYKLQTRQYRLLIGCGEHDIPMELEAIDMWHKSESVSKKVVFKGAGHCVNMDVPEEFNEVMKDFFDNCD
ncbi:alpha/beta fold hydrolase [Clostridium vincentii]|uniref:Putative carboxylesterase nap n=1 Tax=Clostridium vincentii TaxID=52704 RepID=A0A2T0BDK6_9CLOT|nr:alpha/beta hydrolase [Clostridium vincentii]PRR81990.1 putative carboxylesterase nap [Clostridium vincentii]